MHGGVSERRILRARGAGEVGKSYFIREGRLDGEAPTLTALEIEV